MISSNLIFDQMCHPFCTFQNEFSIIYSLANVEGIVRLQPPFVGNFANKKSSSVI